MKLTYIKQAGEPSGDAGDQYTGLDRFGRVVDQRWPQGSSELERVDYGFTPASNRQWRQNLVAAGGQDEYYNYDGLYQVAELNRGTLNSGKTAISGTPSWTEDFTYDPIGNWNNYLTKVSGVTDLDQSRTHNTANETVEIDGSTATVAHDLAGNMVKVPQVTDWSSTNELIWDAWNRLVEVADGETPVAQYRYDGLMRRATKTTNATRHYFYSDRWQILEERLDSETTAERQFIWGERYVDDLVLRDRDVDADGSLDERLYVLSDYFNPTAIADEGGVVVERYGYNAFGLSRVMDADFEPRSASDYDWETRYGAYRYDAETGFYQVRYRYLHPPLGRWLSRDPLTLGGAALAHSSGQFALLNVVPHVHVLGSKIGMPFRIDGPLISGVPVEVASNAYQYSLNCSLNYVDLTGLIPAADVFWATYPNYDSYSQAATWELIGGTIGMTYATSNSCAARISRALNFSGDLIPSKPEFQTNINSDGKRYIISAKKLRGYLNSAWGAPDCQWPKNGFATIDDLRKKLCKGCVAVVAFDGHVGVVTETYKDLYTPFNNEIGDVWILKPSPKPKK